MIALLDVNVLVALFDPMHPKHDSAHEWFEQNRKDGWATCPLTENGVVRIISRSNNRDRFAMVADAARRLDQFHASGHHTFWPDSISLRDTGLFRHDQITGHQQVTDVYLLGLAVRNGGRLATYDRGIQLATVWGAKPEHLEVIDS